MDRALNFLAKDAVAWKAEHGCSSCHHAAMVVWAMNEAKLRQHSVNEDVLSDLTRWLTEAGEGKTSVQRPASAPKAHNSKAIYYALGLSSVPNPSQNEKEAFVRLLTTVKGDQIENGAWVAWPETRPPMFGPSDEIATLHATLALLAGAAGGIGFAKTAAERATEWVASDRPEDDGQARALRLVLWSRLKKPAKELSLLAREITKRQNRDGGWSQVSGEPSDAWATGQALYALGHAPARSNKKSVERARKFLAKTQLPNGSWPMKSRPTKPGGTGADNLIPITGAASAWAVLGLVRTAPSTE